MLSISQTKWNRELIPWTKEKLIWVDSLNKGRVCHLNIGSYLQHEIHHLFESCGYKPDISFKIHLDAKWVHRHCRYMDEMATNLFSDRKHQETLWQGGWSKVFLLSAWAVINKGIEGEAEESGDIYSIIGDAFSKFTFSEMYPFQCIVHEVWQMNT